MSHISRFGNLYHRRSQRRQNNKNNSFFSKIIIFFAGKYAKCYRLIHFSPLFHFLTTLSKIESLFNLSLCSRYRSFFFFFRKQSPNRQYSPLPAITLSKQTYCTLSRVFQGTSIVSIIQYSIH